jgi:uncharacterized protein YggE
MTETTITVQGRFSAFYPAERATVEVSVHHGAAKRQPAFDATLAASDVVRENIEALHDPAAGPITWWSSDSVQVWNEKPWNNEGKQLPPVFHARVGFTAKFSDFTALARWIESVSSVDSVTVGSIDWALTEARTTAVTAEVRSRAVKDAVSKASVYAQSIGLGTVTAVAIADPGMLGDQVHGGGSPEVAFMRAKSVGGVGGGSEPSLSLKPEDIEVSAVVDARFVAR